jgi:hypothetical protein
LGAVAILAGLSLNLLFLEVFVGYESRRASPALAFDLILIATLLIYGVLGGPAAAAARGVPLVDYLNGIFGSVATSLIRWIAAPLAVLKWFAAIYGTTATIGYMFMDVHGPDAGSVWLDPIWIHLTLAAVILVGARDERKGFGASSLWLCKIAVVCLCSLLYLYWDHVHLLQSKVLSYVDFRKGVPGLGFAMLWFATPLLLSGSLFRRSAAADSGGAGHGWQSSAWWGIGAALFASVWLAEWIPSAGVGPHPKAAGLVAAVQGPGGGAIGVAKVLVFGLSILIPLRLAPRLLLDLWEIPRRSIRATVVVGALIGASILFQNALSTAPLPLALLSGVAGTIAGAEAVFRLSRLRRRERQDSGTLAERLSPVARRTLSVLTLLSVVLVIGIGSGLGHMDCFTEALKAWDWNTLGFEILLVLYGFRYLGEALMYDPNAFLTTTALWAWALCFVGSGGTTVLALWFPRLRRRSRD